METSPLLAPPGAGLPWLELQIARLGFAFLNKRATRSSSTRLLWEKHAAISELIGKSDVTDAARQVLIRRLPGMEDSSRFWSVYMTVEHLCLVNTQVANVIERLAQGVIPPGKASTATVKPKPGAGPSVMEDLRKTCERLENATAQIPDLHTAVRYAHPWFGPLDAAGWYFMSGFHMGLHLKQIVLIDQRLKSECLGRKREPRDDDSVEG